MRPGLTANLGVRYDLQYLDTITTDSNNVSPRLGLAWAPGGSGRTVVLGRTYRVSFKAKWLAGSNQINTRLYFNYDFAYRDFTNNFNENGSGWITGFGTRLAFDF